MESSVGERESAVGHASGPKRLRPGAAALALLVVASVVAACGEPDTEILPLDDARSAGDGTVFDQTRDAFTRPLANLHGPRRDDFFLGNAVFNRGWVTAPASVADFDGLGPLFNATNCSACHFKDGRGRPPEKPDEKLLSMLVRLSVPGVSAQGGPMPEPAYGEQLQENGILGVPAEGTTRVTYVEEAGAFADGATYSLRRPSYRIEELGYGPLAPDVMMSPRTAPFMIGLGLLEAIPEETILALADPDDRDGDGISGRPNRVWDVERQRAVVGRFGWKANQPSLRQQNAGAFAGDIGITSALFPEEGCTAVQEACRVAPTGDTPQLRDLLLEQVTFYTHTLAVPGRRDVDSLEVRRGRKLFEAARCSSCHVPTFETGIVADLPEVSSQVIHPFTDLLLHDMGPDLADGRPDFEASGVEWRTAPLWGIGLVRTVNRHSYLLHDGRARGFAEAILWHGGEAARSRESFVAMPKADRDALVAFLESL
ncbi:MAG: thiol oxidoreductase [Labilithrix sp.]|nr:thiol oxidoreductase [Labilithrix sp.]